MTERKTNRGHNIWRLLDVLPIVLVFFSPQLKQSVISGNKHGI